MNLIWLQILQTKILFTLQFIFNITLIKFLMCYHKMNICIIRGGADKSLARPGRKQATATKLGIYSTYSPQSPIHFLAHCPNFCKPLKKNSESCPSNQVSAAAVTSASDKKWPQQGQIQRIGWVIKTMEAQVGQFLLGCKHLVRGSIVLQEQDPLGEFPAVFFLQNVLHLYQQR